MNFVSNWLERELQIHNFARVKKVVTFPGLEASFCLFSFFSHDKYSTNFTYKSKNGALGTQTRGNRMVSKEESTELWRQHNKHRFTRPFKIIWSFLEGHLVDYPQKFKI